MYERRTTNNKGQSLLEYSIVIGIIVVVMFAMNPFLKRGIQGMIRVAADQIGTQQNAEQRFDETGHLDESYVISRTNIDKTTRERLGVTNFIFNDESSTYTNSLLNTGFTRGER